MKLFKKLGLNNKQDFKNLIIQIVKFGLVGVSNTLISLGIYYLFLFFNDKLYLLGYIVGFVVSVLNAYFWNKKFVFKSTETPNMRSFIRTFISYGFTFLLGLLLMYIMVDSIGLSKTISPIINLLITIPLNFLLNKFWAHAPVKNSD